MAAPEAPVEVAVHKAPVEVAQVCRFKEMQVEMVGIFAPQPQEVAGVGEAVTVIAAHSQEAVMGEAVLHGATGLPMRAVVAVLALMFLTDRVALAAEAVLPMAQQTQEAVLAVALPAYPHLEALVLSLFVMQVHSEALVER